MDLRNKDVSILLVEDDDVDAMAVERSFRKLQLQNTIHRARNGKEALDILCRPSHLEDSLRPPFIILLDLNMPIMGGIEFLHELRKNEKLQTCVVFVLTTSEADADVMSAYSENIAGYIVKSNLRDRFYKVIEMINTYCELVALPP